MKMGAKEFRERFSEVTRSGQAIQVTHHGEVIGTFIPRRRDPERVEAALASIERWQEEMRANGVDLEGTLASIGLDPWGEPLDSGSMRE
jgi:antitoxin (DNA-binding transcriptional repressor) of toxin-antitoxin stability system